MVTKPRITIGFIKMCFILAKIHMVTKHNSSSSPAAHRFILAKIHMVTKPVNFNCTFTYCFILAKIHMVTKLD